MRPRFVLIEGPSDMNERIGELEKNLKQTGLDTFKKDWEERDAYAADAYRLVVNKAMCLQCHEIAGYKSSNPTTQGPPRPAPPAQLRTLRPAPAGAADRSR